MKISTYNYPKDYFKFKKLAIENMKQLLQKTHLEKIEYGGTFCADRERMVELRNICKGDLCSVKIEKEGCRFGEIKVGEYHTHPPLEIPPFPANIPSPGDWRTWVDDNHYLSCLGTPEMEIKCFQRKRDPTSDDINEMRKLVRTMEIAESETDMIHPDPQQPAIVKLKKMNDELEKYYYKFSP